MKTKVITFQAVLFLAILLSCNGERKSVGNGPEKNNPPAAGVAKEVPSGDSAAGRHDPELGDLDPDGLPTSPLLAMNSDKVHDEDKRALRRPPPAGYKIGTPLAVSRFQQEKDGRIEWRERGTFAFKPGNKALLADALGVAVTGIPEDCFDDDTVLKSPSGDRVLLDSGGSSDRAYLFRARDGKIDDASKTRVHCVNYDDKRRWFISWKAFLTESLLIGTLSTDTEVEALPGRHLLYTYDLDTMTLKRVVLPREVQPTESDGWSIEAVSPGALLLNFGTSTATVYLDG